MEIRSINYWFVVYLALIEGLSLVILNVIPAYWYVNSLLGLLIGFPVGFIPMFLVLLLYKFSKKRFPIKLNGAIVSDVPLLFPSILNGFFILFLFPLQDLLPFFYLGVIGAALFGFISVLLTALILLTIYNEAPVKVSFSVHNRKIRLVRVGYMAVVYFGLFELFILPLMGIFYQSGLHPFLTGSLAGLIGGSVAWLILKALLSFSPLEALF